MAGSLGKGDTKVFREWWARRFTASASTAALH